MRARLARHGIVVALVSVLGIVALPGTGAFGDSSGVGGTSSGSAVTKSATVVRENLLNGTQQVVESRNVSVSVSQTTNLRGRQEIQVSWTGAHPTGGIVADQNSIGAQQEEYPMVILECRGTDAATAPAAQQLSPSTCWTQSWNERYQDSYSTQFPPYRLDQFASAADRTQAAGAPSPLPKSCAYLPAPTQHWIPFVAANGTTYDGGPSGCAGQAPESDNVGGSALPSNETFGVTGLDGSGSANFDVWTQAENASLGCSTSVPCSLVAIPIMGISCDPKGSLVPAADQPPANKEAAAAAACQAGGNFAPGQIVAPQGQESLAVSGSLWWSASNWRNRISVPLSFAVPPSACTTGGAQNALDIYGSELMVQATGQWNPYFCLSSSLFPVVHVQTGEPEARNLVSTGSATAAFTSEPQPGGYSKPTVNAPVAVTGFGISYVIDGANGQPYTSLKLTPRLLAKLLTESYPADLAVQQEDPALAHNPLNITLDPEFIALNPGIAHGVDATEAASELASLSSDSDVMTALTSYINADPAARAWLNGSPDQSGMVVNPAYKGIVLPVSHWPLLSTFEPKAFYGSDNNDCLYHDPVPFLPLVSAPLATLEDVSLAMQFSIANSTTVCSQIDGTTLGEKLVALGRQTVGHRFLIGVTPLGDAGRYLLNNASLETSPGTFVPPTSASLQAAGALLAPNQTTGTWDLPYASIHSSSADASAYPGTMVVYAAVPTSGLATATAANLATYLRYVSTTGQTQGLAVGQLPPGYLPLTTANGLGALAAYTQSATSDIQAQNGQVPPLVATTSPSPVSSSFTPASFGAFTSSFFGLSPSPISGHQLNSTFFPALVSILGTTLRLRLASMGATAVALIGLTLVLAAAAGTIIVVGRRRGTW